MVDLISLATSKGKDRKCGECTACCTTHGIREIDKPAMKECEHVCDKGCSIYETRPESCARYECAWLQGMFDDKFRPDKCGTVVEMQNTMLGWTWVCHLYGRETFEEFGSELTNDLLLTQYPLVLVYPGGMRQLFHKKEYQKTIDEIVKEHPKVLKQFEVFLVEDAQ